MDSNLEFVSDLRSVVVRLIKKLRKESTLGQQLSLTERSTLFLLEQHKQLLPSELAGMEKITNQSMSTILNNLTQLGYITRTGSETDKRKVHISLSAEGETTVTNIRDEREEWLAKAIAHTCTTEEQEIIKQAIGILTRVVEFE
jgi:DNA-binding MarR family transcriptional regulator